MAMIGCAARDSRTIKAAKATADSSANQTAENSRRRLSASSIVTRPRISAMPPTTSKRSPARCGGDTGRPRNSNNAATAMGIRNQNTAGQSQIGRQGAAEQRTQHQSERHHHRVDAERPAAPFLAIERCHQRHAAAQHQCRADALQAAEHQHRAVAGRTTDKQQRHRAPDQADPENDRVTDGVADAPERQQQAGVGQHVADDDPLDVGDRRDRTRG